MQYTCMLAFFFAQTITKLPMVCTQRLCLPSHIKFGLEIWRLSLSTAFNLMEMGVPKTLVALVIWLQYI